MKALAALERRYRRLLAWFPARHRQEYGEEMVGVLLATARPGQRRPDWADALDLIGGGLRARWHQVRFGEYGANWRDALALLSVALPVLLFFLAAGDYANLESWQFGLPAPLSMLAIMVLAVLVASGTTLAALAVCPALNRAGHRRAAGVVMLAPVAATGAALVASANALPPGSAWPLLLIAAIAVEAVAVTVSGGAPRAWDMLKWKGLALLGAAVLAWTAVCVLVFSGHLTFLDFADELGLPVLAVLLALAVRRPAGLRLLALLAIPGYPIYGRLFVVLGLRLLREPGLANESLSLVGVPTAGIALLVGLVAWWSIRREAVRTPPAADG
jgi:hypothetical protein